MGCIIRKVLLVGELLPKMVQYAVPQRGIQVGRKRGPDVQKAFLLVKPDQQFLYKIFTGRRVVEVLHCVTHERMPVFVVEYSERTVFVLLQ
jgi:hypothetical protein